MKKIKMSTNSSNLSYGLGQEQPRSDMEVHLNVKIVLLWQNKYVAFLLRLRNSEQRDQLGCRKDDHFIIEF